jgi:hypothetical protein
MVSLGITAETPMVFVLELFPRTWPLFHQIGVCCVHDGNMNSTVAEVCAQVGADADAFIDTLKVFQVERISEMNKRRFAVISGFWAPARQRA